MDDPLRGASDSDKLVGGDGADTLVAGDGYDALFGQGGADTFVLTDNENYDMIRDFNANEGDVIDISALLNNYDPLTDSIADFVDITAAEDGLSSTISVDKIGGNNDFQLVANVVVEGLLDMDSIII